MTEKEETISSSKKTMDSSSTSSLREMQTLTLTWSVPFYNEVCEAPSAHARGGPGCPEARLNHYRAQHLLHRRSGTSRAHSGCCLSRPRSPSVTTAVPTAGLAQPSPASFPPDSSTPHKKRLVNCASVKGLEHGRKE